MKQPQAQVAKYGADVLSSPGMQLEKSFMQHGGVSCYAHSVRVADLSVRIALRLRLRVDWSGLVRGALLHDYFLYDWHVAAPGHRLHAFRHARRALDNAARDFQLTGLERDIIAKHMFPLTLLPPRHMETVVVCLADKLCAVCETLSILFPRHNSECGGGKA